MMLRAFREVGGVWIFKPVGRAQARAEDPPSTTQSKGRHRPYVILPAPGLLLTVHRFALRTAQRRARASSL